MMIDFHIMTVLAKIIATAKNVFSHKKEPTFQEMYDKMKNTEEKKRDFYRIYRKDFIDSLLQ